MTADSSPSSDDILIVAGEASSALYAQRILEHYKRQGGTLRGFGIGSRAMESLGFECIGRSENMAVVGLSEVIKHYPMIRKVFYRLVEECERRRPKLILLLDYPDFNLRLAKKLKPLGIPIVYYISPQIWAWRKSRIHQIKSLVNKMLVLLPFEVPFYQTHGVDVEFVGHPLLDEIDEKLDSKIERIRDRSRYGVGEADMVVGLMPGSRISEIEHHLNLQIQAAEEIYKLKPNMKFMLFVAPSLNLEDVRSRLRHTHLPLILIQDEPFRMIRMADVIVTASGTATLMVGLMGVPMVIIYRMNPLSAWIAKRFVKGTEFFGLINLVLSKKVVPELFQEQAHPQAIADELLAYINRPELHAATCNQLLESRKSLGAKGATQNVVRVLDRYLNKTSH